MQTNNNEPTALFSRAPAPTTALSDAEEKQSRKNLSAILQRLASIGQVRVAESLGVSEATVSRLKDGELERIATILAVLRLKTVSVDMRCMRVDQMESILALAKARMESMSVEHLTFED